LGIVSVSERLLDSRIGDGAVQLLVRSLYHDSLRRPLIRAVRNLTPPIVRFGRRHGQTPRIDHELETFGMAIVSSVDRAMEKRAVSREFMENAGAVWARALAGSGRDPARLRFVEEHGVEPPWVLVVAPTAACNLRCAGCYSGSSGGGPSMPFTELERLVDEAKRLWGIKVVVFTGGEPLLYRSESRGILDIVERNPDVLFLIFTNGTLINRTVARRLVSLGTPTVALSVEGLREATDARRGAGAFDDVLRAIAELKDAGALAGISVTATRDNCEELFSDEFLDFFFIENSMLYGFIFQYMPEGRDPDPSLMVTCEQRLWMWKRTWDVIENRGIVLFDFWNQGSMVGGCVAAGRERGYLYVDWDGNVLPCVFAPYAAANIHELHAQGRTINDAWASPFLAGLRDWQRRYAAGEGKGVCAAEGSRLVCACPVRDHYDDFREMVLETGAMPIGPTAGPCLSSSAYARQMSEYGRNFAELSRPVLDSEYDLH
jgi:MoaA/NifB/PqqE/SkfB family radical SAM enzyme